METKERHQQISTEVMIGNFAIARGFVEAGIDLAAAYPGTPSSEILPGIVEFKKREKMAIHTEWSVNERCAMEVAFGAALNGKKAVCMMKQVGLNVAFPALLRGREKPIKGALVIVSCDDPGPQSSQTEQDTRLLSLLFGILVLDPASPAEAADIAYYAVRYSSEHHVPVIIRPTHRVSHAREAVPLYPLGQREVVLQEGAQNTSGVSRKPEVKKPITPHDSPLTPLGIVASGMSYSITADILAELALADTVPVYKITQLPASSMPSVADELPRTPNAELRTFVSSVDKVLVLEETDVVIEAIIGDAGKVLGRRNGYVPGAGELTYDIMRGIIERVATESGIAVKKSVADSRIEEALKGVNIMPRPPKLCAGCPHRASFYAMRRAFPDAIFPGDIGCYTLGISMGAVDTCTDMGGGVILASGFYDVFHQDRKQMPIIASIGDSTFFHAGLSSLYDAAKKNKRFILVIMDNSTTAMTGMQPTPQSGLTADGIFTRSIKIEDIIGGFGIGFLRILDPYDVPTMISTLKEANEYLGGAGPAVIIARRECLLNAKAQPDETFDAAEIEKNCIGCKRCISEFECPALVFDDERKKVEVDDGLCMGCGICLYACPKHEKGKHLQKQFGKRATKKKAQ